MTSHVSLRHQQGDLTLQADVTLEAGITALFGPSGAGKTSILRAIAGLLTPDQGRIEINGTLWLETAQGLNRPTAARGVGYVFQEPRLFPHMTVAQNLQYGQKPGMDKTPLVKMLGLSELLQRRPTTLSGGEAQRVSLARALLTDPKILLMDEPLSALDLGLKRDIFPYLDRLRAEARCPILYVSHDLDEVTRLADRIILIEGGKTQPAQSLGQALATAAPASRLSRAIAGGLLEATIHAHHPQDHLTEARIEDQPLWLPGRVGGPGDPVRLRVDARDVMIAARKPDGLSALNALPVTITAIDRGPGSGALVRLDHQGQALTARVTQRSVRGLGLAVGQNVHAVLKTMAVTEGKITEGR